MLHALESRREVDCEWPDLLHHDAVSWGDLSGAREFVRFAYEGGDCEGVFESLFDRTPLASSRFDVSAFEGQLHVAELLRGCFRIVIGEASYEPAYAWLERAISSPPGAREHIATRQELLEELHSRPELREDLERLYLKIRQLRTALEAGRVEEPSSVRRKIAVLNALRECIDALANGFEGAGSALGRLRRYGENVTSRESYRRLAELLDFDDHVATVDVRLQVGADGAIRGFAITEIHQNITSALLPGPVMQFLHRVLAFFRGHRFGENEVVLRLLDVIFSPMVDVILDCLRLTAPLELYLGSLAFRDRCEAEGLDVCLPEFIAEADAPGTYHLEGLFNPLLFLQDVAPIPCDLPDAPNGAIVIVTGPNSGGKTRLLQAIALTQCLGQAGLFVPAKSARLLQAPGLFVSLVIEQDAAQKEGRLGTELMRIRHLFEGLEPGALAILDELCSGTNPNEGEAIFEMVVSLLPKLRSQVFISTHFLSLAARLEAAPPIEALSFLKVELDDDERPTFGFIAGVAETSLAHRVAERLGVTKEQLERLVAGRAESD